MFFLVYCTRLSFYYYLSFEKLGSHSLKSDLFLVATFSDLLSNACGLWQRTLALLRAITMEKVRKYDWKQNIYSRVGV